MFRQLVYTRMMIKKIRKKIQSWCFFEKEFRITLLWVGVQSANAKKKKNSFPCFFLLVIENNIHEKRILKGLVKLIEWVTQECCKKVFSRKKRFMEKHFHARVFWMIVLSVGVQRSEDGKQKSCLGPLSVFSQRITFKMIKFLKSLVKINNGVQRRNESN